MKEPQFIRKLIKMNNNLAIEIPVYYGFDEQDNVLLDIESMEEEFNNKIKKIEAMLK